MEEEHNNNEAPKADRFTEQRVEKGITDLLEEKELKIKWRKELEDNPEVVAYFENFRGNAMKEYLDHYINQKHLYYTYGDMYKNMSERKRNQWIDEAHEQLGAILQKQLFDKQCLWRAEQITLEGVEIAFDFDVWEQDVFNCPFLDPISSSDIALYQSFLNSEGLSRHDLDGFYDWQNYDEFKKSYTTSEDNDYTNLPEWFEFHNSKTGNSTLLLMVDAKGAKEEFYIDLYFKSEGKKEAPILPQQLVEVETRPFIETYCSDQMALFVDKFESKALKDKYKYYFEMTNPHRVTDVSELLDSIIEAGEPIPVSAHHDILEAIEMAYDRYCLKNIAAHLPLAYDLYLLNKQMGINTSKKVEPFYYDLRDKYKERILAGRELNGEERNFDF